MSDFKDKLKNAKDKVAGETKEAAGKVTDNEELELKGKLQSKKADISKKVDDTKDDVSDSFKDTKETTLEKINRKMDERDDK